MTNERFPSGVLPPADELADLRRLGFSIAYRMLGSAAEAEDLVQEALLRLHRAREDGAAIESAKAYLSTVTTRLAIDYLRSARVRRESYVGPWLPEPLVDEREPAGARHVEMAESLSMAFLVMLERLSPLERAVFLLREIFEYGYGEIASIVGKSEDNCRQILARARRHVEESRPRFEASPEKRDELAERFFAACQDGDLGALVHLLAADATFEGDGGGKASATTRAVLGRDRVARLVHGLFARGRELGIRARRADVNGQPGLVIVDAGGRIASVMALDVVDGAIVAVRCVVNPDKLRRLGPVTDLTRIPSRERPSRR